MRKAASTERILKLIQDRFDNGTAAALDVAQQASLVAIVRASILPLMQQVEQNCAALALPVGMVPEHIEISGGSMFSLAIPRVTPGLPSELLVRRPDVREAEARLAGANVAPARAAFFPTIQLTAQGGFQSLALATLFGPGAAFDTVATTLTQPIFERRNLARPARLAEGNARRVAAGLSQGGDLGLNGCREGTGSGTTDDAARAAPARRGAGVAPRLRALGGASARWHHRCRDITAGRADVDTTGNDPCPSPIRPALNGTRSARSSCHPPPSA
jgi:hypothetical protein